MIKKRKKFDCIAMKRELQQKFYEETRGMSPEELIEHIHRKVETGFDKTEERIRLASKEIIRAL